MRCYLHGYFSLIIFFMVRKCCPCIGYYDVSDQHWSTYLQLRKTGILTLMLRPNLSAFVNCEMPSPWKTDSHSWIMSSCNPCSLIKWGYTLSNSQDWEKLFKIPKWCSPGKTLQNNTNGIWYICQGTYCREDTANEICFILLFLYFSGICSHVYESDVMNGWLRVDCTVILWPVKQNLCQSGCRRDLVPEYSTSG